MRHGDRSGGYGDVPLSPEGENQARRLAEDPTLRGVEVILSSPKLRTQQTVTPLSEKLQLPIEIENGLDQRKTVETAGEFEQRIFSTMDEVCENYPDKTVLLCTHSDWLQTAVLNLDNGNVDHITHSFFGCAQFKSLSRRDGHWDIQ